MWPIEEYGKGKGQPYGVKDPVTGEAYYGRGFVQLTWKDNYAKMTPIVDPLFPATPVDLVKTASQALVPDLAAAIMFEGMERGIFRKDSNGPQTLSRYFDVDTDDPYGAREIINGDKKTVPSWSGGVSIGKLIAGYHGEFLTALKASLRMEPVQPAPPIEPELKQVLVAITKPAGVEVTVTVNGDEYES